MKCIICHENKKGLTNRYCDALVQSICWDCLEKMGKALITKDIKLMKELAGVQP